MSLVPNDCEFLPIDIDEIATRGRESEREMVGERDREQGNDKSGREKERKTDRENEKERETERERGYGISGNEKRKKNERKTRRRS